MNKRSYWAVELREKLHELHRLHELHGIKSAATEVKWVE